MKRMKLKSLGLSVNDLLTREQLKTVYGGSEGSGSGGECQCYGTPGRIEHCFGSKIQCARPTVGRCPNATGSGTGIGSGSGSGNCFEYCNASNASCWL